MAQFNGQLGWLATAPEAVAYGTLGIVGDMTYQQGISASLKQNENRVIPPVLGSVSAAVGRRLATWSGGSVTLGHTDLDTEMADIYEHVASKSTLTYTFGATTVTGEASISLFMDIDQVEYDVAGAVVQGITWNLSGSDYSTVTLDVLAKSITKYGGGARTPTIPPSSEIITPGDISIFTIDTVSLAGCIKGATINWRWPTTDIGRQRFGSTTMPIPLRIGRPTITATFNLELDNATGANTVDILDDYLANTSLATINLDQFTLAGCTAVGEIPDLNSGLIDVNLSVEATSLLVTTTAV